MTLERDAAFLAGFIVGTYDLKGEQAPPAYLKPFLDRVLTGVAPLPETDLRRDSHPVNETSALITSTTPEPDLPELTRKMLDRANESTPPAARAKQPDWEKPGEVIMGEIARNLSLNEEERVDPPAIPDSDVEKVRQMVADGKTDSEIAARYGCTNGAVIRFRKKHGMAKKRGGARNFRKSPNGHAESVTTLGEASAPAF